jgi:hypothetical protein
MDALIRKVFFLFLLIHFSAIIQSQTQIKKELISTLKEADQYYYYHLDYESAATLY